MKTNFEPEDIEVFRALIREEVRQELAALKPKEIKYFSRGEACELLKISLPTLGAWAKKGLITSSKIGNRVLIEDTEIQRMILKMKNH